MRTPYNFKKPVKNAPPPGLLNALVLGCVYGYFALNMSGDPNDCYANDDSDDRISESDSSGTKLSSATNVGSSFVLIFKVLFFLTLIEAFISVFAYSVHVQTNSNRAHSEPVYKMAVFFYAIASLFEVLLWIYLFVLRFSHAGQVCSGDFLSRTKPSDGYTTAHGRFIKVIAILVCAAFACVCCMGPYLSARRKRRAMASQRSIELN